MTGRNRITACVSTLVHFTRSLVPSLQRCVESLDNLFQDVVNSIHRCSPGLIHDSNLAIFLNPPLHHLVDFRAPLLAAVRGVLSWVARSLHFGARVESVSEQVQAAREGGRAKKAGRLETERRKFIKSTTKVRKKEKSVIHISSGISRLARPLYYFGKVETKKAALHQFAFQPSSANGEKRCRMQDVLNDTYQICAGHVGVTNRRAFLNF